MRKPVLFILTSSARFKKFPTEAEAKAFVAGGTPPTRLPANTSAPAPSVSGSRGAPTNGSRSGQVASGGATPNVTAGAVHSVPKGSPHPLEADGFNVVNGHLVVYTDGSSLANGTKGAAAGAGVFFGHAGKARDMNVAERVGGSMQTNNRGELLVSTSFTLSSHAFLLRREEWEGGVGGKRVRAARASGQQPG